jgi:hypothetical protein
MPGLAAWGVGVGSTGLPDRRNELHHRYRPEKLAPDEYLDLDVRAARLRLSVRRTHSYLVEAHLARREDHLVQSGYRHRERWKLDIGPDEPAPEPLEPPRNELRGRAIGLHNHAPGRHAGPPV